ncbi:hypothetical protein CUU54_17485 [Pectobacterium polaris]|uniref:restriction endonuclease subunit S n=1 Tax=Pectobacterium polaris TaxID=2042057 RepID=UPI000D60A213|nr:restriction endonuclease subunit S [Pectobacterium polaris]MCU1790630.1 hypothetical protein [Pectobacterium polaris]PWD58366.1 hypothetical protein DF209_13160 [Pectobacterium polaris]
MIAPYPNYVPSDIKWVEALPEDWKSVPFYTVASESKLSNKGMIEDNLLSLSFGRIKRKSIDTQGGLLPASFETYQIVNENDIIFRLTDLQNDKRSLRSAQCTERGIITSAYVAVTPSAIRPRYLHYLMRAYDETKVFYNLGAGMRQSLKYDELKRLPILLPPELTQQAIEKFLDRETQRIDSLIEEKQTFIKLLKEKRQALITHVVTKGLNPNVEMQDSGIEWIGQVPKHWVIRRLKHTSTLQSGIAKGKDNANKETLSVPMLRVANVQDGYVKLDDVHEINVLPHEVERYALKDGDVLMNEGGDNDKLGRGTVWKEQIKPCIHQNHVFVIRVTDIEPEWLGWLTQSAYAKFYFFRVSKQSTNLASISSTNVKEVQLLIPPADERKIIMEYLEKQTSKLKLLVQDVEQSITLLKEHRTSLISAVVTGKIDVREAV